MPTGEVISVLIVDDHPVVRDGLKAMLSAESDIQVAGEAGTGADGVEMYRALRPAVTLMDMLLPDLSGAEAIQQICSTFKGARVIVLTTASGDEQIHRALDAGARGYLFKDMVRRELVKAIRAVAGGSRYIPAAVSTQLTDNLPRSDLSPREIEVLKQIAVGLRNKEIGYKLSIAEATVNVHIRHILEKLNAADRTQAVMIALRRGLLQI